MSQLAELEQLFWRTARGEAPLGGVDGVLEGSERFGARAGAELYANMYFFRQAEALREAFPRSSEQLQDRFRTLVKRYVLAHPSEHPALEQLGRVWPEHLAAHGVEPVLVDLARLEWAHMRAFLAPDPPELGSAEQAAELEFASATARFVESLQLLELDAASLELWRGEPPAEAAGETPAQAAGNTPAKTAGEPPAEAAGNTPAKTAGEPPAETAGERVAVVVWREGFSVRHRRLEADEAEALRLAMAGASFAEVCEAVARHAGDDAQARALEVLGAWFSGGLVQRLIAGNGADS